MPGARVARHRGLGGRGLRADKTGTLTESGMRVCGSKSSTGLSTGRVSPMCWPPWPPPAPSQRGMQAIAEGLSLAAGLGRGRERAKSATK